VVQLVEHMPLKLVDWVWFLVCLYWSWRLEKWYWCLRSIQLCA